MAKIHTIHQYSLVTVQILYYMPDHPTLLQTFLWQDYDVPPDYPRLGDFIRYWEKNLDAKLHSVEIADKPLSDERLSFADFCGTLH